MHLTAGLEAVRNPLYCFGVAQSQANPAHHRSHRPVNVYATASTTVPPPSSNRLRHCIRHRDGEALRTKALRSKTMRTKTLQTKTLRKTSP